MSGRLVGALAFVSEARCFSMVDLRYEKDLEMGGEELESEEEERRVDDVSRESVEESAKITMGDSEIVVKTLDEIGGRILERGRAGPAACSAFVGDMETSWLSTGAWIEAASPAA